MVQTMGAYVNKKEMSSEHSICINHRLNWNWPFVQDMHLITMMQHMHCTLHSAQRYRCPQNKWHIAKAIGMSRTVQQFRSELKFWILIEFLQASAGQKPVSKRLAHFLSSHHFALLFVLLPYMQCYAVLCYAMLCYGGTHGGKTILWKKIASKSLC